MNKMIKKVAAKNLRKARIRNRVTGTSERPRLTVTVSNTHVSAQIIDDSKSITLVQASTIGKSSVKGSMTEKATYVGTEIAKKAKSAKITKVVFDRNGKIYHGRVKALADAARAEGLEF
jgi:large subunit ribosomal protein L18